MSLSSWVLWENDRCLYGRCVFEPTLMERLANATVSELDPVDAARALLSFDDLASAERAEQQFSSETHSKDWAPYYLQKVPRLLERQEIAKAISALAAVHDEARSSPAFLLARMAVEEAAGDRQGFLEARADVTLAARDAWRPSDWRMSKQNQLRLQLLTAADAKGITVDWLEVHNSGGAVSLFVDGRRIGTRAIVNARSMSFQFLRPLPAGLHLLEIQRVAGRVGVPGSVKLIAAID